MADAADTSTGDHLADGEEIDNGRETVHHTVTACVRCRQVSSAVMYISGSIADPGAAEGSCRLEPT